MVLNPASYVLQDDPSISTKEYTKTGKVTMRN